MGSEYFNFALNPRLFPPKPESAEEVYDVSFVGTTHLETRTFRYDSLKQLLFPLIPTEVEINVWGNNWLESREFQVKEFGASVPLHRYHGFFAVQGHGGHLSQKQNYARRSERPRSSHAAHI